LSRMDSTQESNLS
jgi:hypothetical protein